MNTFEKICAQIYRGTFHSCSFKYCFNAKRLIKCCVQEWLLYARRQSVWFSWEWRVEWVNEDACYWRGGCYHPDCYENSKQNDSWWFLHASYKDKVSIINKIWTINRFNFIDPCWHSVRKAKVKKSILQNTSDITSILLFPKLKFFKAMEYRWRLFDRHTNVNICK